MSKRYWKGVEELRNDAEFVRLKNNEFFEPLPLDKAIEKKSEDSSLTPRRDFLKFLGFSVAAASLAACETPVRKSIPYLVRPEEITPGVANWYASTYYDGYDYCSVLVKTREGRPIKLEGNELSKVTRGGVNARVQASVLSLYDNNRLKQPLLNGKAASWADLDKQVMDKLSAIASRGGKIRMLSSTVISPVTQKIISDFNSKYPGSKHIVYDAVSSSAMREANQQSFGMNVVPSYSFDKADVIVSFGADFLVNWISPVEYSRQYAETRKVNKDKKKMSRHYQFESTLSVSGSNADYRYAIKPSQQGMVLAALYNELAGMAGVSGVNAGGNLLQSEIKALAAELWANRGRSVVVCGINDTALQNLCNGINSLLESYGATIDLDNPNKLRQGNDADVAMLLDEMAKGEVAALLVYNANPVYSLPDGKKFGEDLKKVELSVSFSDRADETASLCQIVAPDHHSLEAWSDAEPKAGHFSLGQPSISPLFDTRQFQESLLNWMGNAVNIHDYMSDYWTKNILRGAMSWEQALQAGVFEWTPAVSKNYKSAANLSAAADAANSIKGSDTELVVYEKVALGSGIMANNPWLQELPDPISKLTWDNYVTVSPFDAREKGYKQGNMVSVSAGNTSMKLPVVIQPGQASGTLGVALGYGRTAVGKVADNIGANAFAFTAFSGSNISYNSFAAKIDKTTDEDYMLAGTQTHHTMMGRAIVKETTLREWIENPKAGNPAITFAVKTGHHEEEKRSPKEATLWDEFETGNHHWGMAIDLNSCIGCGSCVVACTAENNVAVVGKLEVQRSREMHWIRIDRYYTSDADVKQGGDGDLKKMELPSDQPKVVFQPVMCQHCNHAPCETVCPVIATSHSSEGLNQMTYNRCVGTRYCANNCPYKVRRFNWFKYSDNPDYDFNMNNDLGKMVLNPDVVVRSRGVMEKCSMCVQRLQDVKLTAKKEGRKVKDGEVKTACAQSCPTHAITFGDFNNKESQLNKMWEPEGRSYTLLEELNVQPNVFYMTKVRNVKEAAKA